MRKHRHRWVMQKPVGLVQIVYCRSCPFRYEQFLLFDPREYMAAA